MLYELLSLHCQHKHAVLWFPVGAETDWGLNEPKKKKKKSWVEKKKKKKQKEPHLHMYKYWKTCVLLENIKKGGGR